MSGLRDGHRNRRNHRSLRFFFFCVAGGLLVRGFGGVVFGMVGG